jgi:hypothetical protein
MMLSCIGGGQVSRPHELRGVKLIAPQSKNSDGIHAGPAQIVDDCFIVAHDDALDVGQGAYSSLITNTVVWNTWGSAILVSWNAQHGANRHIHTYIHHIISYCAFAANTFSALRQKRSAVTCAFSAASSVSEHAEHFADTGNAVVDQLDVIRWQGDLYNTNESVILIRHGCVVRGPLASLCAAVFDWDFPVQRLCFPRH